MLQVLVVDTSLSWGKSNESQLSSVTSAIRLFARSFLALHQLNRIAVVSSHPCGPEMLLVEPEDETRRLESTRTAQSVVESICGALAKQHHEASLALLQVSGMASALSMALCYVNRLKKSKPLLSPRILFISRTGDDSTSYVSAMNVLFALQKQSIILDTLAIASSSSYLNQGASLTDGLYVESDQNFSAHLLGQFTAHPSTRSALSRPPQKLVDTRASCFCHGEPVDQGFVCSICLAIYCAFLPVCGICSSKFEFEKMPSSSEN